MYCLRIVENYWKRHKVGNSNQHLSNCNKLTFISVEIIDILTKCLFATIYRHPVSSQFNKHNFSQMTRAVVF